MRTDTPWSTDFKARLARVAIILIAILLPSLVTWSTSDSFRDFVSAQPWVSAFVPLIIAILTQIGGQLAGKATPGGK